MFIGYCAKGTLGDRLLRGDPIIRLRNRDLMVYASIKQTDLLSGHGDHNDLVNNVKNQDPAKLKNVFLVHGESSRMKVLKDTLDKDGYRVTIPERGETFEI